MLIRSFGFIGSHNTTTLLSLLLCFVCVMYVYVIRDQTMLVPGYHAPIEKKIKATPVCLPGTPLHAKSSVAPERLILATKSKASERTRGNKSDPVLKRPNALPDSPVSRAVL